MGAIQDRLIAEVGVERVLQDLGFDLSPLRSRRLGNTKCPFHSEQNGAALSVNLDTGLMRCFGHCDRGFDLVQAFGILRGIPEGPPLYKAVEEAYLSRNGARPAPPPPTAIAKAPRPPAHEKERDERYCALYRSLPKGPPLAELFEARTYRTGSVRGVLVVARDPVSGFATDLKRRQTDPKPPPERKSMSSAPWCLLCNGAARRDGRTCEKDHPDRVFAASAGLMGLKAARAFPDHRPVLVAGEKDLLRAAGLVKHGVVPVSWSAGETSRPNGLGHLFQGTVLAVLYDADERGAAAGPKVVDHLRRDGVDAVLALWKDAPEPILDPSKGQKDLADWLDLGGSLETLAGWLLRLAPSDDQEIPLLSGPPTGSPPGGPPEGPQGDATPPHEGDAPLTMDDPYAGVQHFVREKRYEMSCPTLRRYQADFYQWVKTRYRVVEEEEVRRDLYDYCVEKGIPPTKNRVTTLQDALKVAVLIPNRGNPPFWVERTDASPPDALVAFENTLYDPERGLAYPHSPNFFSLNSLPFPYDPMVPEPVEWLRFLRSLWPDDPTVPDLLQEIFGYCLGSDTRFHKMFVFFSEQPRCGKGTIAKVLRHILGPENVSALQMANFSQHFGIETLIGKIVNITPDARFSYKQDEGLMVERFLSISAGDTLSVPRKNRTDWTGALPTKLVLLSNEIPAMHDFSSALASRMVPIHFHRSWLGHEDTGLLDRLLPEASGILNWSIEGRRRLYARGRFPMPKSSASLHQRIEARTNPLRGFVAEFCEIGTGYTQLGRSVFQAYRAWCEQEGRDFKMVQQTFFENMMGAAPGVTIATDDYGRKEFRGLRLREDGFAELYGSRPEFGGR